jgi:hypothetical protein
MESRPRKYALLLYTDEMAAEGLDPEDKDIVRTPLDVDQHQAASTGGAPLSCARLHARSEVVIRR